MANNKNELKVIQTEDGSFSIYTKELDETYHSVHGALQESNHVFIKNGLRLIDKKNISILEVGLGTGLSAALSCIEAVKKGLTVSYTALEPYPLGLEIIEQVAGGYPEDIAEIQILLAKIEDGKYQKINAHFNFIWHLNRIQTFNFKSRYDLIYFDAFAPGKQPDMWTLEIFKKLYDILNPGGIFTTYCAKGEVKRNLKLAGFTVKAVEGPPGKREMTVAHKELDTNTPQPKTFSF